MRSRPAPGTNPVPHYYNYTGEEGEKRKSGNSEKRFRAESRYDTQFEVDSEWINSLRSYRKTKRYSPSWVPPERDPPYDYGEENVTRKVPRSPPGEVYSNTPPRLIGRPAVGSQLHVLLTRDSWEGSLASTFHETRGAWPGDSESPLSGVNRGKNYPNDRFRGEKERGQASSPASCNTRKKAGPRSYGSAPDRNRGDSEFKRADVRPEVTAPAFDEQVLLSNDVGNRADSVSPRSRDFLDLVGLFEEPQALLEDPQFLTIPKEVQEAIKSLLSSRQLKTTDNYTSPTSQAPRHQLLGISAQGTKKRSDGLRSVQKGEVFRFSRKGPDANVLQSLNGPDPDVLRSRLLLASSHRVQSAASEVSKRMSELSTMVSSPLGFQTSPANKSRSPVLHPQVGRKREGPTLDQPGFPSTPERPTTKEEIEDAFLDVSASNESRLHSLDLTDPAFSSRNLMNSPVSVVLNANDLDYPMAVATNAVKFNGKTIVPSVLSTVSSTEMVPDTGPFTKQIICVVPGACKEQKVYDGGEDSSRNTNNLVMSSTHQREITNPYMFNTMNKCGSEYGPRRAKQTKGPWNKRGSDYKPNRAKHTKGRRDDDITPVRHSTDGGECHENPPSFLSKSRDTESDVLARQEMVVASHTPYVFHHQEPHKRHYTARILPLTKAKNRREDGRSEVPKSEGSKSNEVDSILHKTTKPGKYSKPLEMTTSKKPHKVSILQVGHDGRHALKRMIMKKQDDRTSVDQLGNSIQTMPEKTLKKRDKRLNIDRLRNFRQAQHENTLEEQDERLNMDWSKNFKEAEPGKNMKEEANLVKGKQDTPATTLQSTFSIQGPLRPRKRTYLQSYILKSGVKLPIYDGYLQQYYIQRLRDTMEKAHSEPKPEDFFTSTISNVEGPKGSGPTQHKNRFDSSGQQPSDPSPLTDSTIHHPSSGVPALTQQIAQSDSRKTSHNEKSYHEENNRVTLSKELNDVITPPNESFISELNESRLLQSGEQSLGETRAPIAELLNQYEELKDYIDTVFRNFVPRGFMQQPRAETTTETATGNQPPSPKPYRLIYGTCKVESNQPLVTSTESSPEAPASHEGDGLLKSSKDQLLASSTQEINSISGDSATILVKQPDSSPADIQSQARLCQDSEISNDRSPRPSHSSPSKQQQKQQDSPNTIQPQSTLSQDMTMSSDKPERSSPSSLSADQQQTQQDLPPNSIQPQSISSQDITLSSDQLRRLSGLYLSEQQQIQQGLSPDFMPSQSTSSQNTTMPSYEPPGQTSLSLLLKMQQDCDTTTVMNSGKPRRKSGIIVSSTKPHVTLKRRPSSYTQTQKPWNKVSFTETQLSWKKSSYTETQRSGDESVSGNSAYLEDQASPTSSLRGVVETQGVSDNSLSEVKTPDLFKTEDEITSSITTSATFASVPPNSATVETPKVEAFEIYKSRSWNQRRSSLPESSQIHFDPSQNNTRRKSTGERKAALTSSETLFSWLRKPEISLSKIVPFFTSARTPINPTHQMKGISDPNLDTAFSPTGTVMSELQDLNTHSSRSEINSQLGSEETTKNSFYTSMSNDFSVEQKTESKVFQSSVSEDKHLTPSDAYPNTPLIIETNPEPALPSAKVNQLTDSSVTTLSPSNSTWVRRRTSMVSIELEKFLTPDSTSSEDLKDTSPNLEGQLPFHSNNVISTQDLVALVDVNSIEGDNTTYAQPGDPNLPIEIGLSPTSDTGISTSKTDITNRRRKFPSVSSASSVDPAPTVTEVSPLVDTGVSHTSGSTRSPSDTDTLNETGTSPSMEIGVSLEPELRTTNNAPRVVGNLPSRETEVSLTSDSANSEGRTNTTYETEKGLPAIEIGVIMTSDSGKSSNKVNVLNLKELLSKLEIDVIMTSDSKSSSSKTRPIEEQQSSSKRISLVDRQSSSRKTSLVETQFSSKRSSMVETRSFSRKTSLVEGQSSSRRNRLVAGQSSTERSSVVEGQSSSKRNSATEAQSSSRRNSVVEEQSSSRRNSVIVTQSSSKIDSVVEQQSSSMRNIIVEEQSSLRKTSAAEEQQSLQGTSLVEGQSSKRTSLAGVPPHLVATSTSDLYSFQESRSKGISSSKETFETSRFRERCRSSTIDLRTIDRSQIYGSRRKSAGEAQFPDQEEFERKSWFQGSNKPSADFNNYPKTKRKSSFVSNEELRVSDESDSDTVIRHDLITYALPTTTDATSSEKAGDPISKYSPPPLYIPESQPVSTDILDGTALRLSDPETPSDSDKPLGQTFGYSTTPSQPDSDSSAPVFAETSFISLSSGAVQVDKNGAADVSGHKIESNMIQERGTPDASTMFVTPSGSWADGSPTKAAGGSVSSGVMKFQEQKRIGKLLPLANSTYVHPCIACIVAAGTPSKPPRYPRLIEDDDENLCLGEIVRRKFDPRPGDVMIVRERRKHRFKDNGYVRFYTSQHETYNWCVGDFILRCGRFHGTNKWNVGKRSKLYQRTHDKQWMLVGLVEKSDRILPLVMKEEQVNASSRSLVPRRGDFIIRLQELEGPSQLEPWTVRIKINHGDILARAYVGDVGLRCDPKGTLEGQVELYVYGGTSLSWIFMGRDICKFRGGHFISDQSEQN